MKNLLQRLRACAGVAGVIALAFLTSACASTKRPDWNSRIGLYTFDQAVAEMGVPDKQAKLSDGKTVAEWITRRSGGSSISFGTGFYGRRSAFGVGHTVGSGYQDFATRLTFDTEGRLVSWSGSR